MGIAERKEREKTKRKNDIVDAAEKLFFTKGFINTAMDEIAAEAELSKGTLYLYFKSKEDLYLAINHRGLSILEKMFKSASLKGENGLAKTYNIGQAYFEFSNKYPNYFNAMIYYESHDIDLDLHESSAQSCEEQGQRVLAVVASAIEQGISDESIRADIDPMDAATVLWAHSTGVIMILALRGQHLNDKHNVNVNDVIDLSFEMTKRALKK